MYIVRKIRLVKLVCMVFANLCRDFMSLCRLVGGNIQILRNQAGFSLLEMSVVIIIMGIMMGALLPTVYKYQQINNTKITNQRLDLIMYAIAAYVGKKAAFPEAVGEGGGKAPRGRLPWKS